MPVLAISGIRHSRLKLWLSLGLLVRGKPLPTEEGMRFFAELGVKRSLRTCCVYHCESKYDHTNSNEYPECQQQVNSQWHPLAKNGPKLARLLSRCPLIAHELGGLDFSFAT